jgi:hypothetical protein
MFFLTQIDPRAAIKGSRDPMGFQPIWTAFGRQIVGNLTTITTSVKNFATLLLGCYFAEEAIACSSANEQQRAALFLKFEQLAAYSRHAYSEGQSDFAESPLGIRRVIRRFHDDRGRLRISANREHQILSNQKTYGLWGLYSVAARQSGFLEPGENRLTQTALSFIESEYLPALSYSGSKNGAAALRFLTKDAFFEPKGKDRRLGKALAQILGSQLTKTERAYYLRTLLLNAETGCNNTAGRQQQTWEIIRQINEERLFRWNQDFGFQELMEITKRAHANEAMPLATALQAILIIEPVLAASSRLFSFLLRRNEAPLTHITKEIQDQWGRAVRHIEPSAVAKLQSRIEQAAIVQGSAERVIDLAEALGVGDYAKAVHTALTQNAEVMKARGGGPWLVIERNRLKVRLREESGTLPEAGELPRLWVNSYFLNSLKTIGRKIAGKA